MDLSMAFDFLFFFVVEKTREGNGARGCNFLQESISRPAHMKGRRYEKGKWRTKAASRAIETLV